MPSSFVFSTPALRFANDSKYLKEPTSQQDSFLLQNDLDQMVEWCNDQAKIDELA